MKLKPIKNDILLDVVNLQVHFPIKSPFLRRTLELIKAVDNVSFTIPKGKIIGLVGESGSGKTTLGRALIRLSPITNGKICYQGQEIQSLSRRLFFPFRKKIQMVFQDPYNSLNPRLSIQKIVEEPLQIHFPTLKKSHREEKVIDLLEKVGLEGDHRNRYPHQFSGGQRQRIGIARALAVEPEFIICDEAVSALDVSIQAQIINLLQDLQEERKLTYLFIAHDLAVVEHISDYLLVMNQGKIVEQGDCQKIYRSPKHPYTQKLFEAIPEL